MGEASALECAFGSFHLEIQQSILVWFGLCILFGIFFYFAGKKIDQADPRKKPTGLVYLAEEMVNLTLYVTEGNLREKVYLWHDDFHDVSSKSNWFSRTSKSNF